MSIGHSLAEEQVEYIRLHYKDTTNYVLAETLGISRSAVCRVAKTYHLKKTNEHYSAMGRKAGLASSESRGGGAFGVYTDEIISKRVESFKRTFHEDQVRWRWGLPTKTRLRVRKQPKGKCNQRTYLTHLGYILDEVNCIAYYTPETHRATRMEAYKTKRNYYKFRKYEPTEHQREPEGITVAD